MANGRCRMHGGKATGAPKGNRNAWKHGAYAGETVDLMKAVQEILQMAKSGSN